MADKQITPFQLTDQFTMDNFNQRINETNIALQKMVNPNLLDNWYFSNPVDQRGGYVVPPGTDYYYIGGETVAGTTAAYYTVKSVDTNGNATFAIDGTDYWCIGKGVRGYTGGGYGIDRWKQLYDSTYCLIQDGYVSFYGTDFGQMIETKIIPLNTPLTYSVLTAEGILGSITFQFDGTQSQLVFQLIGETKFRANFIYNWGNTYTPFFLQTEGNVINVVAMKLELGSQQTLAHQDADGNWVLNEIPNYGEQLARCQMYRMQYGLHAQWVATQVQTDYIDFSIYLPVSMRKAPSIEGASYLRVYNQVGNVSADDFTFSVVAFSGNNVRVRAVKTNHGYTSAVLEAAGAVAFVDEL